MPNSPLGAGDIQGTYEATEYQIEHMKLEIYKAALMKPLECQIAQSELFQKLIGIFGLSATEVFSCLSKKVICPCAYVVVFQIFVSFVLQCKFVCKVQDELDQGL